MYIVSAPGVPAFTRRGSIPTLFLDMPNFAAEILKAHADFAAADISTLDPPSTTPEAALMAVSNQPPQHDQPVMQGIQKCIGDYDKLPLGWRESPFMGKCGFKVQHKNFYSADTPCYPIQDISCMGPAQKRAWAHICATEFPCRPPTVPPPSYTPTVKLENQTTISGTLSHVLKVGDEYIAYILGVSAASCLAVGLIASKRPVSRKEEFD